MLDILLFPLSDPKGILLLVAILLGFFISYLFLKKVLGIKDTVVLSFCVTVLGTILTAVVILILASLFNYKL